jgi:hypothetical protein
VVGLLGPGPRYALPEPCSEGPLGGQLGVCGLGVVQHHGWDSLCKGRGLYILRGEEGDLWLLILVGGVQYEHVLAKGDPVQLCGEGKTGVQYNLRSMREGHILQDVVLVSHVLLDNWWQQVLGGDGVLQGPFHAHVAILLCHTHTLLSLVLLENWLLARHCLPLLCLSSSVLEGRWVHLRDTLVVFMSSACSFPISSAAPSCPLYLLPSSE